MPESLGWVGEVVVLVVFASLCMYPHLNILLTVIFHQGWNVKNDQRVKKTLHDKVAITM